MIFNDERETMNDECGMINDQDEFVF